MATKVEVNEDDLKKVVLMLKMSKEYIRIPNDNLQLINLWRVASKLADKLMRKANLTMETTNGRAVIKSTIGSVSTETKTPRCRKRKM